MANKQLILQSNIPVEQKVMGLLMCTAQEKSAEVARLLKPLGLSFTQLSLLHALDWSSDKTLTVGQLKQTMVDDSPNVSRALNKLVEKEFIVKRRCDQDQRTVFISITPEGEAAHAEGDKLLMSSKLPLSQQDMEQLLNILSKL